MGWHRVRSMSAQFQQLTLTKNVILLFFLEKARFVDQLAPYGSCFSRAARMDGKGDSPRRQCHNSVEG